MQAASPRVFNAKHKGRRVSSLNGEYLTSQIDKLIVDATAIKARGAKTATALRRDVQKVAKDVMSLQGMIDNEAARRNIRREMSKGSHEPSHIKHPVKFAADFLDSFPHKSRKEAIDALVDHGVNPSTARTQYQRWFKARH